MAGCAAGPDGANELDPTKSPLSEYYAGLYGSGEPEDYAKIQKKVEEVVAACMADEGFEYIPVDQSQYSSYSVDDEGDRNTPEWVAENGYGITTQMDNQPQPDPEQEVYEDPNQPYVESLSPTEQAAYYETLYGVSPTEEEMSSGEYVYSWENSGCQGAAQHEVQPQPYDDEKYKPLLDSMNAIYEDVQGDPVVAELDASWSSCMADAGYSSFSKKQDAIDAVVEESNALYASDTGEPPADDEVERVQTLEIETAVADFECSQQLDYQDKSLAVQFALEEQFIADNKTELDAMLAEYEQAD